MARSAAALIAALILPGSVVAQDPTPPLETPSGTHTVVDYDTLWDLAEAYLSDPWQWPRIWDANRALVENPDLIYPGWVLVIPGLEGEVPEGTPVEVTEITVEPTPVPVPQRVDLSTTRTVFYRDTAEFRQTIEALAEVEYAVVSRDGVYSAPWLLPPYDEPESTGVLRGQAGGRPRSGSIHTYQRVELDVQDPALRVGDLLQVFRVTRSIPDVGEVVSPTGIITVSELNDDGAIGVVTREYARVLPGDYVRPAPAYPLTPGQRAEPISGGSEAVILGFQGYAELRDIGSIAFLDIGSDDGVALGDLFELFDRAAGSGVTVGAVRVVHVTPGVASARIVHMEGAVFNPGVVVQLTRKMR